VSTEAHINAIEYLRSAKRNYGGVITFNYVPREQNVAGIILEKLLLEEKSGIIKNNISIE
jgi:hypothetical protein